ncbi:3511_t:CDS:1, partial [Cetraspora pellucida]
RYHLCKHLVHEKNIKEFIPKFSETSRRHDHPLFVFGKNELPPIAPMNNPWIRFGITLTEDNPIEESSDNLQNLQNILVETRHDIIEKRQEKYIYYKKKFEMALTLYEHELDNDKFIANFDTLVMFFLKEIDKCEEVLQSPHQQKTWTSDNSKLAFWLR